MASAEEAGFQISFRGWSHIASLPYSCVLQHNGLAPRGEVTALAVMGLARRPSLAWPLLPLLVEARARQDQGQDPGRGASFSSLASLCAEASEAGLAIPNKLGGGACGRLPS